jgi:hypothetical protein
VQVFKNSKTHKQFKGDSRKRKSETTAKPTHQASSKKFKVPQVAKPDLVEAKQLALEYDRCQACGFYVAATERNKHATSCKKDPKVLVKRMWRVKSLKAEGKTKAEINPFAKGGK